MKIAITGATGFVGKKLVQKLGVDNQIIVLTRNLDKAKSTFPTTLQSNLEFVQYTPKALGDWQNKLDGCDGVVNLAGAPIAQRWTPSYKKEILDSRELGTQIIVTAIKNCNHRPKFLINASAIGFYGTSETATYTEISPPGDDFLGQVCQKWEKEAHKVQEAGVRLVIFRLGIVLGDGGALAKMIPSFKVFAGGPIGEGNQWFSWIHIDDLVNLMVSAIADSNIQGTFNATAPYPIKMSELCDKLGDVMNRPSWLPVPSFALELLLGDGAKVVLEGQKVLPEKTIKEIKYNFQYSDVKSALQEIVD